MNDEVLRDRAEGESSAPVPAVDGRLRFSR
ncbi:hypothetical protein FHR75_003988 [Kineococcus radiotolerans]|uniref:Uncharacterized protein n=1 Tax=Kineococcus radiotolerans TaxID=131568 RepID=A0A7W4TRG1_KINRA|nr:hypothetical protein [Kineococcus radiotolerans]